MPFAGNSDLTGRIVRHLVTGDLFHHVGIDMTGFQKIDAMLQVHMVGFERRKLLVFEGQLRTHGAKCVIAAGAEHGVITKIGNDRGADRRDD